MSIREQSSSSSKSTDLGSISKTSSMSEGEEPNSTDPSLDEEPTSGTNPVSENKAKLVMSILRQ